MQEAKEEEFPKPSSADQAKNKGKLAIPPYHDDVDMEESGENQNESNYNPSGESDKPVSKRSGSKNRATSKSRGFPSGCDFNTTSMMMDV